MEKLTEIYNELMAMGVLIIHGRFGLSGNTDSTTIKAGGRFGVFLDTVRIRTGAQELDAASHEWAHIVSDATYGVNAPPDVVAKAETRATRTQIERVLPYREMLQAMKAGDTTAFALAEHFGITEDLVHKAYDYYTGPCGLQFWPAS